MRHCAGGTCDWKEVLQSQCPTRSRTTIGVMAARGMLIVFPPKRGFKGLPRRESASKAEGGVPYHTRYYTVLHSTSIRMLVFISRSSGSAGGRGSPVAQLDKTWKRALGGGYGQVEPFPRPNPTAVQY